MNIKIDTEKKVLTITNKTNILDLLIFITDLNLDINEWDIDVEERVKTEIITVDKKPDWTNPNLPWITPPYTNPVTLPWIQPPTTYPTWKPDYYQVTCLM